MTQALHGLGESALALLIGLIFVMAICWIWVKIISRFRANMLIWGLLFLIGTLWLCHFSFGNPILDFAFMCYGKSADGFIVESWEEAESGDEGGTRWSSMIKYTYRVPGAGKFTGKAKGPGRLKEEFRDIVKSNARQIEVTYLPRYPGVSALKDDVSQSWFRWSLKTGAFTVFLIVGWSMGLHAVREGVADITGWERIRPKGNIGQLLG